MCVPVADKLWELDGTAEEESSSEEERDSGVGVEALRSIGDLGAHN